MRGGSNFNSSGKKGQWFLSKDRIEEILKTAPRLSGAAPQAVSSRLPVHVPAKGSLPSNAGRVLVGTASWSDPGFVAHWYPKGMRADERLRWYAQQFEM